MTKKSQGDENATLKRLLRQTLVTLIPYVDAEHKISEQLGNPAAAKRKAKAAVGLKAILRDLDAND